MKRLLLIASLLMGLYGCVAIPVPAQYLGSTSQLTTSQAFSQTMAATATHLAVTNVGQVGHTLLVKGTNSAANGCVVSLDGSQDGTTYALLGSVLINGSLTVSITVNGYFPILRLTFNFEHIASCNTGTLSGSYVGYQFPLTSPINNAEFNLVFQNITSPALLVPAWSAFTSPWQVFSLACTNPGATAAYVEFFDTSATPTLGSSPMLEFGIPAGATVTLAPRTAYTGFTQGWIGAATTPTGSTAVGTGVVCSTQYTNNPVVWPALWISP